MKKIKTGDMWLARYDETGCDATFTFQIVSSILIEGERYFVGIKAFFDADEVANQIRLFNKFGVSIEGDYPDLFRLTRKSKCIASYKILDV